MYNRVDNLVASSNTSWGYLNHSEHTYISAREGTPPPRPYVGALQEGSQRGARPEKLPPHTAYTRKQQASHRPPFPFTATQCLTRAHGTHCPMHSHLAPCTHTSPTASPSQRAHATHCSHRSLSAFALARTAVHSSIVRVYYCSPNASTLLPSSVGATSSAGTEGFPSRAPGGSRVNRARPMRSSL